MKSLTVGAGLSSGLKGFRPSEKFSNCASVMFFKAAAYLVASHFSAVVLVGSLCLVY